MTEDVSVQVVAKTDFAKKRYPPDWDDPENLLDVGPRSRRLFLANPLSRGDEEPVQIVALHGARVAGRLCVFSGEVAVDGVPVPVLWGSGLLVSRKHRRKGIGQKLVQCWQSLGPTATGCGTSDAATLIYRKLRWVEFTMPRYILLCHSRSVVSKYVGAGAGAAISPLVDATLRVHNAFLASWSRRRTRGLRVKRAASISTEFDPMLARSQKYVVSHRSAAWVNWLLDSSEPDERRQQRLYFVYDQRNEAVGYFMVRRRFHKSASRERFKDVMLGSLKDWIVFDSSKGDDLSLILLGVRELLAWGVDAVEVCVTCPAVGRALARLGFLHKGDLKLVFHAAPESPLASEPCRAQRNWRITGAEGDNFYN